MTALAAFALWLLASFPLGIVVGKFIKAGRG